MIPYVIHRLQYDHMSGGARALHVLKDELLARGLEASMFYEYTRDSAIMVYPEVIKGNPQNQKKYVKWLLNKAEFLGERCWSWEVGCGNHPLLTVNIIELDIWKPVAVKNNKVAYWVGKGRLDTSVLPENAVEISRFNFPDRVQLAEFVAGLDHLISFDPFTALTMEAAVANTPVLIHNTYSEWTIDEVRNSQWLDYGIATNPDEMEHARQNVHLARGHYESLLPIFSDRIDAFIEATQTDDWPEDETDAL